MNNFYEWLYDNYAKPRLSDCQLSSCYRIQRQEWQVAVKQLSRRERLLSEDLMNTLKNDWGALSFACGIQFGLSLATSLYRETEQ